MQRLAIGLCRGLSRSPAVGRAIASCRAMSSWRVFGLAAIWLGGVLAVLSPLLTTSSTLAFRDAGHFYLPLYRWQSEGEPGRWYPHENLGGPALSDPTWATGYPPHWLLTHLPGDWVFLWHVYLVGHVLFAGLGACWLVRRLGWCGAACWIAALSYAASGTVLIQTCNVIYLVGAAWLPWTLGAIWGVLDRGGVCRCLVVSGCLGMMVLGGDPQMAYHAVLMGCLGVAIRPGCAVVVGEPRGDWSTSGVAFGVWRWLRVRWRGWGLLAICAAGGLALAWVQVEASGRRAADSERQLREVPRSLWEAPGYLAAERRGVPRERFEGVMRGWFGEPVAGTHHEFAYQFSLSPWQLAELCWPNVSGRSYPEHRRWTQHLPSADRVWFPSLYAGFLSVGLALSGLCLAGRERAAAWLRAMLLFSVLASFGWYGLGWLWRELSSLWGSESTVGGPVGGLYWLLTIVLPGYVQFRYPAKWMVVGGLALAGLAGFGWERLESGSSRWHQRVFWGLGGLSVVVWLVALLVRSRWMEWAESAAPDAIFGPLQVRASWWELQAGLLQGGIGFVLVGVVLMVLSRWGKSHHPAVGIVALLVLAGDLSWAHRGLLVTVERDAWEGPGVVAGTILEEERGLVESGLWRGSPRLFRGYHEHWTPSRWWQEGSEDRMSDVVGWDHATVFPKHHLSGELSLLESPGAMVSGRHWLMMQAARQVGWVRPDRQREPSLSWLSRIGADYLVVPSWSAEGWSAQSERLQVFEAVEGWPAECLLLRNPDSMGAMYWADRWDYVPFEPEGDLVVGYQQAVEVVSRLEGVDVVVHDDGAREWLEGRDLARREGGGSEGGLLGGRFRVVEGGADRWRIAVRARAAGVLVLNQTFDEGWSARLVDGEGGGTVVPLYRVNGVATGVLIPAGEHRLELVYEGGRSRMATWLTWVSWAVFGAVFVGAIGSGCLGLWGSRS